MYVSFIVFRCCAINRSGVRRLLGLCMPTRIPAVFICQGKLMMLLYYLFIRFRETSQHLLNWTTSWSR